jgi:hypothetical protein
VIILTGGAFAFPALLEFGGFDGDGLSFAFSGDFIISGVESGEFGNGNWVGDSTIFSSS